jgi:class 3 adenylate cyclase
MAEARKTVTVVFTDVTGSTSLGERLDPEALRRVMERYFGATRSVLERHGGMVEKFIGDAVMAVFGIPTTHEDDALRAVKAAAEMRERLAVLNTEIARERGVRLTVRTGINTGEAVVGDPESRHFYATGDAVNVAARLEEAAAPGEILLGPLTQQLVRDAVRLQPLAPLSLKGRAEASRHGACLRCSTMHLHSCVGSTRPSWADSANLGSSRKRSSGRRLAGWSLSRSSARRASGSLG